MTRPVPGGYLDRRLLSRARRANTIARRILGVILDDPPGPDRLALMLAQIAHVLGEQAEALNEMARIREPRGVPMGDLERLKRENERLQRQVEETRRIVERLERLVQGGRQDGDRPVDSDGAIRDHAA